MGGKPRQASSRWSLWSQDSLLCIGSKGSVLSIGSIGSCLSVGSIGSFASWLSIGSFASGGSVMAARSRWSIMSWRSVAAVQATTPSRPALRLLSPRAVLAAAFIFLGVRWGRGRGATH